MSMGYDADYVLSKRPDEIAAEMTNLSNRRISESNRALSMERALKTIADMINNTADVPRDPTSLPMAVMQVARRAANYQLEN